MGEVDYSKYQPETRVTINGWTVPLLTAWLEDGGKVGFAVDGRLAHGPFPVGMADQVARLLADVIAVAWGYGAHPTDPDFSDLPPHERFARVPHPSLAPHRVTEISAVLPVDERND